MAVNTLHQELLQKFAEEATEHVQQFNKRLLMLKRESAIPEVIDEMALGMHSLERLANMSGIEEVARVSSVLKSALDDMASGKILPSEEIANTLHDSSDRLQELIQAVAKEENGPDLAPVVRKLKSTLESRRSPAERPAPPTTSKGPDLSKVLTDTQKNNLSDRIRSGLDIFQISCYFRRVTFLEELESIQKEMARNGDVISTARSEDTPPSGFDLHFKFVLASRLDKSTLSKALHIHNSQIQQLQWGKTYTKEFGRANSDDGRDDAFVSALFNKAPLIDDSKQGQRAREVFFEDFADKMQKMSIAVLHLEKGEDTESQLRELLRICHNLKGTGTAFGFPIISAISHYLETILDNVKKGQQELSQEVIDVMLVGVDSLQEIQREIKTGILSREKHAEALSRIGKFIASRKKPVPSETEETKQARIHLYPHEEAGKRELPPLEESIRVRLEKLDDLMDTVCELTIVKNLDSKTLDWLEKSISDGRKLLREWNSLQSNLQDSLLKDLDMMHQHLSQAQITEKLNEFGRRIADLTESASTAVKDYRQSHSKESNLVDRLQSDLVKVRMMPVGTIFDSLDRVVRDFGREHGKEVSLHKIGGDLELDKKILEQLKDPLTHLIRNAIVHGIESPDEREKLEKPRLGAISLNAHQIGSQAVIEVEDDGRGIDVDAVKRAALTKGFLKKEKIERLSEEELVRVIFQPGFTTRNRATELSGRGIGMDVVWTQINKLGGAVDTWYKKGAGTRFSLRVPLTLALTRVLLAQVNGSLFSIPVSAVESVHQFSNSHVKTVGGKKVLILNRLVLPLVELSGLLGLDTAFDVIREQERRNIVVLSFADRMISVMVDELDGEYEVMTRGLGPILKKVRRVTGVNILADGRLSLLVNPQELFDVSQRIGLRAAVRPTNGLEETKNPVVLVVEDSALQRELTCSLLATSGYETESASNGYEALQCLRKCPCDLIVTELDLPNIGGYELVHIVRSDEKLSSIPVVVVTVKDKERDRKKAFSLGADAYIVKGAFDQQDLLRTVTRLIGKHAQQSKLNTVH
jgi:two-component system chemotaxis sensor kinase CheA